MYMTLAFLALLGAQYIYDISSLRVNEMSQQQQATLLLISADCLLCFTYLTACCASRIAKKRKLIKPVLPIMYIKLMQNAL